MVRRRTRKNRKQAGGSSAAAAAAEPLATMPQICVGTAQYNKHNPCTVGPIVSVALAFGYRHIDGAQVYGHAPYRKALGAAIKASCVPRNEIWITWKSDTITKATIAQQIADLNCAYIDLFLIHHGCGTPAQFAVLQAARDAGQIRHFGVSNCEDIEELTRLKETYNIFANQIQAGPPGANIAGKAQRSRTFVEDCNALGVAVMLYAPISGVITSETLLEEDNMHLLTFAQENSKKLNRYYTQKYVSGKPNVLMVGSTTGHTLPKNIDEFKDTQRGTNLLTAPEMAEMETFLTQIVLNNMG